MGYDVSLVDGHIEKPKMSDEEIIKALEGLIKNFDGKSVDFAIISFALDLINRQKAEIEQLKAEIDIIIRKKETLRDEIFKLQTENERLREMVGD